MGNLSVADRRVRHDWTLDEVEALFHLPFADLMFQAQEVHRAHFDPNKVQLSRLLSVKTGSCPEDCAYCPQSAHFDTGLEKQGLMQLDSVVEAAQAAKAEGATRFCMGAAWRGPRGDDFTLALEMIRAVRGLGMETCASFGLLSAEQAGALKEAGLDYYNHNIDTSEAHYANIISTRSFQDRLDTLERVRDSGMKVCCGGIVGLGEGGADRARMLHTLASMPEHPESVPINLLIPIPGTPLAAAERPDPFDFIRTIAVARILMPRSFVRLSAGREQMNDEMQALCFLAGANSIFTGEKLLTTRNPAPGRDQSLFDRLGLRPL
jgi:biotin synthase